MNARKLKKLETLTDELGAVRAQLADLKDREGEIKATLGESGLDVVEGELFRVAISHTFRKSTAWKAIAAKLKPSRQLIAANTVDTPVTSIRTSARQGVTS